MDTFSRPQRSRIMSRIHGRDTQPELRVRKTAHKLGLRYRLHIKELIGSPDIVFPRYRTALFVHGCFWHQHPGCSRASVPKSRQEFWTVKLRKNVERDHRVVKRLENDGWRVEVIWECETKNADLLRRRITAMFAVAMADTGPTSASA